MESITSEILDLWGRIFYFRTLESSCRYRKCQKKKKKTAPKSFGFSDNFSWIGNGKFSLLLRKYSLLAVNVLTRSPKISDLIKKIFFELTLAQIDEKIESKYFSAYIWGFWDKLALWLPKMFQKKALLCI